jgi:AI-2 transport protein TqsA
MAKDAGESGSMDTFPEGKHRFPELVPLVVISAGLVAALYFGQTILRPLALAILISVLLNAAAERITRIEIFGCRPRYWMGLTVSIGAVIAALTVIAEILASQTDELGAAWPRYAAHLEDIVAKLSTTMGPDISHKIETEIARLNLTSWLSAIAGTTTAVVSDAGLISLYVAFLLAARSSNAQKLAAMFPLEQERMRTARLLSSMSESTGKYILIKTVISIATGLVSYAIMKLMGLDFAETWALLIFLLNYIPTIGSIIAVIFPSLLALLQFETLPPFLVIAGLLTAVQMTIGNVIEPIFMGRTLNLSSLAVLLALGFWGTLWGIVGMFMSVPITVMLVIFFAHVPQLRGIAVLLSADGRIDQDTV